MTTSLSRLFVAALVAAVVPGCMSSLVDGACADGYEWSDGACRPATDPDDPGGPDADPGPGDPDAAVIARPDAAGPVCEPEQLVCDGECTDVETDANACGACGIVCPSGICADGACVGGVIGRVILIGHDYRDHNVSSRRLLGNALDLPAGTRVRVAVWRGNATTNHANAMDSALDAAATAVGLSWTRIDVDTLPQTPVAQVVVLMPQDGSSAAAIAAGTAWADAAQDFITAGGVIITLGGHNTVSHDVLVAAGLLDAAPAPDATGDDLIVSAPTDALAAAVLAPYRAELSTSAYQAGRGVVVVQSEAGDAVVIDAAGL